MTRVQQTIHVKAPIEEAFDYVADFSTTAEWDPGIAEASRLDVGPSREGSRFRVIADFNGRKLPLEYTITAFDLDASDTAALTEHVREHQPVALVSSLPYFCNLGVAEVARAEGLHYFDLTEDVAVTEAVRKVAEGATTAFVPQCGLAPGFISIVANELIQHFDKLRAVKLRVGALPQHPNNVLKYSLTWSTDGVINEYGNLCNAIVDGKGVDVLPLEGLESIEIDGKNRKGILKHNNDCRQMTLPQAAIVYLEYGVDRKGVLDAGNDDYTADFRLTLRRVGSEARTEVFSDRIDLDEQVWRRREVDLSPFALQNVAFCIETQQNGIADNATTGEYAFWRRPAIRTARGAGARSAA